MTGDLQADPLPAVFRFCAVSFLGLGVGWWLLSVWERMWMKRIASGSFYRQVSWWQRTLFRGRLPMGQWRSAEMTASIRAQVVVFRATIIFMALLLVVILARRVFGHAA